MITPGLLSPAGREIIRGLVAFSGRGRAALVPTADGLSCLPEYDETLTEREMSGVVKANASASVGDWYTARRLLDQVGFEVNIR